MAKRKWFVTFEDLKNDFRTNPKYILFNPTKIELSKLKQHVLQQINLVSRSSLNVNQWQNSPKKKERNSDPHFSRIFSHSD